MPAKDEQPSEFASSQYFSSFRRKVLKIARVVIIIATGIEALVGLIVLPPLQSGISAYSLSATSFATAAIAYWALRYISGTVRITSTKITSQNFWKQSKDRKDIARLDIVATKLLGHRVLLPTVTCINGETLALHPIAWMTWLYFSPWTPAQQLELVQHLRTLLQVDGRNDSTDNFSTFPRKYNS